MDKESFKNAQGKFRYMEKEEAGCQLPSSQCWCWPIGCCWIIWDALLLLLLLWPFFNQAASCTWRPALAQACPADKPQCFWRKKPCNLLLLDQFSCWKPSQHRIFCIFWEEGALTIDCFDQQQLTIFVMVFTLVSKKQQNCNETAFKASCIHSLVSFQSCKPIWFWARLHRTKVLNDLTQHWIFLCCASSTAARSLDKTNLFEGLNTLQLQSRIPRTMPPSTGQHWILIFFRQSSLSETEYLRTFLPCAPKNQDQSKLTINQSDPACCISAVLNI